MPFTNINTQVVTEAGIAFTPGANDATNGNVVDTGNNVWLYLKNTGGSSATVTVAVPATQSGMAIGPRAIVLAASATRVIRLPSYLYAQAYGTTNAGRAQITFSAAATVDIGVFNLA